jgi:FkbM family methyltransferase
MSLFSFIRKKYHPLFHLRRLAAFRQLQRVIDPDVWIKVPSGGRGGMCVKLLRDLSLILPHDGKEAATRHRFDQLLREQKPEVFLDIGANVGIYSWHAKTLAVPVILMFEPDGVNARLLSRTIRANRFTGVFLIPCAVSASVGVAEFVVDHASGATGSLIDDSGNGASLHSAYGMKDSVTCPTICLDAYTDYCRSKAVVLKIDVEGAEDLVFQGGRRFFREVRPWMIVECFEPRKLDWLAELGHEIEPLDENGNFLLTPPSAPD